jgi:arabinofuranan 3-O-arabinosyltransferase
VSINFGRSIPLTAIIVFPLDDGPFRPRIEKLRITTQRGTLVHDLPPGEAPQILRVPQGQSRWLRLTIDQTASPTVNPGLSGAGIRDVAIPGVTFQLALSVPSDEAKPFSRPTASVPTYIFSAPIGNAAFNLGTVSPLEAHMIRYFTVPQPADFGVSAMVTPRQGAPLDAIRPPFASPQTTFALPCGLGPPIQIDGVSVPTQVTGTVHDLLSLSPLTLTSCANVPLVAGRHVVVGADGEGPFRFTSLILRHAAPTVAPEPSVTRTRSVTLKGFGGDNRQILIGPGGASYVAMASNFNPWWSATLGGRELRPVRLDGWQQGWSVPAGHGGTILVTFNPDHIYRISLLLGLVLLLGVFVLAVVPSRSRRLSNASADWIPSGVVVVVGAAAVLVALGGPVAVALVPTVVIARVWPRLLPWVVAAATTSLGILLVLHAGSEPSTGQGAFGPAAQLCTLVALAAVLGGVCESAITSGWWRKRRTHRPRHARDDPDPTELPL